MFQSETLILCELELIVTLFQELVSDPRLYLRHPQYQWKGA